tara:strand:+ start:262 stop:507 length:246 start_codon:yes stop_codon:yes gene_type:complete
MSERTPTDIAELFLISESSVRAINELAALSSLTEQQQKHLRKNVEHLEIIKAYKHDNGSSIWTTEDWTTKDNAVTLGRSKL